jgi:hypothetical protein
MKKLFKGCIITFVILVGVVIITGIGLYLYSRIPNDVVVLQKPLHMNDLKDDIFFPEDNTPRFIIDANEDNIVYQAAFIDNDFSHDAYYILLIRPTDGTIRLKNKLPIRNNSLEEIDQLLHFNKLKNPFRAYIELPKTMETEPGIRMKVYNPNSKEILNLQSGFYQYFKSNTIDNQYYTEVILYDKTSNLLYYERMRHQGLSN